MPAKESQERPVQNATIAAVAQDRAAASQDIQAAPQPSASPGPADPADKLALAIETAPSDDTVGMAQGVAQPAGLYTNLWDRVRAGFQLPQVDDPLIAARERWFADNPEYLARLVERARICLYYIVDEVEKRGMPLEIALLPAIESAYQTGAYSRAKAMGLWQFIAPTARRYGVKINWWYDGRRDVLSSTRAALDYLQALHDEFDGDWFLALSAYNAGEAEIQRQVDYNRRHGQPADYQHLRLRAETRHYVPNLMAIVRVIADPAAHGIQLAAIPNEPYFAVVDVDSQIDLNVAAQLADAPLDVLHSLNPGLNRWATPPNGPHRILVPVDNKDELISGLSQLPVESRVTWRRYHVKRGDSLGAIARRYGVSVQEVQRANKLHGTLVRAGRDLVIPTPGRPIDVKLAHAGNTRADSQRLAGRVKVTHHVHAGESLWSIARHYGVHVQELAKWNTMSALDPLQVNQTLNIWSASGVD